MEIALESNKVKISYSEAFEKLKLNFYRNDKNASIKNRIKKLKNLRKGILKYENEIVEAIYKDLGKPEIEAKLFDIKPVLLEIDHACKHLKNWANPKAGEFSMLYLGTSSKTLYDPLGVVLILSPWNFPFNLSMGPLVSAIAAGNNVVLKPSELSEATTIVIHKIINECFNLDEIIVFTGDSQCAKKLLELPFNHIFFTGSPVVGKKVMEAAAHNLSSVTLELGGCNPAIVDDTVNIKDAAEKIVYGKLVNSGQSCLSVNTVYVDRKIEKEFTKALLDEMQFRYLNSYEYQGSSIINEHHLNRIIEMIDQSKEMGAIELTKREIDYTKRTLSPTLLVNVPLNSPVIKEEIFGPVLPVVIYDNLDNLISSLQKKDSPLAVYIFSSSNANIKHIIKSTSSGTIAVNETTLQFGKIDLPFGGINTSGIGKAHGYHGFLTFTNQRSMLKQRIGFTLPKLLYPPYSNFIKKMADIIYKYL